MASLTSVDLMSMSLDMQISTLNVTHALYFRLQKKQRIELSCSVIRQGVTTLEKCKANELFSRIFANPQEVSRGQELKTKFIETQMRLGILATIVTCDIVSPLIETRV